MLVAQCGGEGVGVDRLCLLDDDNSFFCSVMPRTAGCGRGAASAYSSCWPGGKWHAMWRWMWYRIVSRGGCGAVNTVVPCRLQSCKVVP